MVKARVPGGARVERWKALEDYEGNDALAVGICQKEVIGKAIGRRGTQRERWRVIVVDDRDIFILRSRVGSMRRGRGRAHGVAARDFQLVT